ncbi:methyl-accepting chemotaxis protein [Marinicrinis sediminis]|uniref:Methyl-accepting chemotaxis protein n=1 Tax=Marinicrinis sediminis TaxID=1652465 RepID=A0ABW5R7R7_9BACL
MLKTKQKQAEEGIWSQFRKRRGSRSLAAKLSMGFGVLCLFLMLTGGFSLYLLQQGNENTQEITDEWMPSVMKAYQLKLAFAAFMEAERDYLDTQDAQYADVTEVKSQELQQIVEGYVAASQLEEGKKLAQTFQMDFEAFGVNHNNMMELVQQGNVSGARLVFDTTAKRFVADMQDLLNRLITLNEQEAARVSVENEEQARQGMTTIMVVMGVVVIASALLAIWTILSVLRPIRKINHVLADLSEARGDLTRRIDIRTGDEIERMGHLLNQVLGTIEHMVVHVRQTTDDASESANRIEGNCQELSSASEQIAAAIIHLSEKAEHMLERTVVSRSVMQSYSDKLDEVALHARETCGIAGESNRLSRQGNGQIQEVLEQMKRIEQQHTDVQQSFRHFLNVLTDIDDVNRMIQQVSQQTNLLSLNASIEAKRAGEHGKGFEVVAHEIRKLSQQAGHSSKRIVELLAQMKQDMNQLELEFNANEATIEEGSRQMGTLRVTFDQLEHANQQVVELGEQTQSGVLDIQEAAASMLQTIQHIHHLSNEQSASSEEISASAQEQQANTHHIQQLSSELVQQFYQLKERVGQFATQSGKS